jgi:hypothetical protein
MKVPTVDGPSVQQQAAPNAYQTAPQALGAVEATRAQQLRQAAGLAQAYGEFAQREQNKADLDSVFRAETALKDDYLKFEREQLGLSGIDAKGAAERSEKWWGEAKLKYSGELSERAYSAYERSFTQLRQASASTLMRHEQRQTDLALEASAKARIGSAIELAQSDPNPERLATAKREIIEAVSIVGNRAGLPPEAIQAQLAESLTLMHRGVVMRMLDAEQFDEAKAYYFGNKKEINGGTQLALEKSLDHSGKLQKAQTAADEIMGKFGDIGAAMEHIEKTYSGEDEKSIKAEVHSRFTVKQQASNAMSQKAYESGLLAIGEGRKVPASAWAQMDDGHKAAILDRQRAEAKRRETESDGRSVKTDLSAWDQLNRMVTDDPKGFASVDLLRFQDKVSKQDLMEFANIQRKIRSGDDKPVRDSVTLTQQIDVVQDQLKIKPNTPQSSALRKAIYDDIARETQLKGKELSYEEQQKVIDRKVIEVSVPGAFFGTNTKRAYELTPEERQTAKVKISDDDRARIEAKLKAAGQPADAAAVEAWYRRWKGL